MDGKILKASPEPDLADLPDPRDFGFGQLYQDFPDAVVVGNVETGCIHLWNPAAENMFGIPAREAIEYVCRQPRVEAIVFGASSRGNIRTASTHVHVVRALGAQRRSPQEHRDHDREHRLFHPRLRQSRHRTSPTSPWPAARQSGP